MVWNKDIQANKISLQNTRYTETQRKVNNNKPELFTYVQDDKKSASILDSMEMLSKNNNLPGPVGGFTPLSTDEDMVGVEKSTRKVDEISIKPYVPTPAPRPNIDKFPKRDEVVINDPVKIEDQEDIVLDDPVDVAIDEPVKIEVQEDIALDDVEYIELEDEVDVNEQYQAELDELNEKYQNLETEKAQLQAELKSEQAKLNSLQEQKEALYQQYQQMQNRAKRISKILDRRPNKALYNQYKNLTQQCSYLAKQLSKISSSISSCQDKVNSLQGQISTYNTNISSVSSDIEKVQDKITQNNSQKTALQTSDFLSNITQDFLGSIGSALATYALGFLANIFDKVAVEAQNYTNQVALTSILSPKDRKKVAYNGIDLTQKMSNGENRYDICLYKDGSTQLIDKAGFFSLGRVSKAQANLYRGNCAIISLNDNGTINYKDKNGVLTMDNFEQIADLDLGSSRKMNKALDKAASTSNKAMKGLESDPVESFFKLGFMASHHPKYNGFVGFKKPF